MLNTLQNPLRLLSRRTPSFSCYSTIPSPPLRISTSNNSRRVASGTWKPFIAHNFIRPHDLSYKSRRALPPPPRKRPEVGPPSSKARHSDVFHQFKLDPLSQSMNPHIIGDFVSEMGKIYGRSITGLSTRTQRRLGKAIRRAKMMGIIPALSAPQFVGTIRRRP
ncbi:hypothetical protein AMATHDRAFT_3064 [Amanita thiersii Skay4041]|uniref:Small ribosomal subunit protein bS18m n=1 Tax=Amanita thiersii Skay4041 TaxID=703135 RepID=A0A2A9NKA8_9AGAR|nr:hypothetical protein AMATHDRAFT_3064 [Amanita thiersii Skay4041]